MCWTQHQRAHQDPAALNNTFHAVMTAGPSAPRDLLGLQRRCLYPGVYAAHLERWLQHYQPSQVTLTRAAEVNRVQSDSCFSLHSRFPSTFFYFTSKRVCSPCSELFTVSTLGSLKTDGNMSTCSGLYFQTCLSFIHVAPYRCLFLSFFFFVSFPYQCFQTQWKKQL